jgi:hypothetical protein
LKTLLITNKKETGFMQFNQALFFKKTMASLTQNIGRVGKEKPVSMGISIFRRAVWCRGLTSGSVRDMK